VISLSSSIVSVGQLVRAPEILGDLSVCIEYLASMTRRPAAVKDAATIRDWQAGVTTGQARRAQGNP
jgi:hypothetical protein